VDRFESMRIFAKVVEKGSFAGAAARLHYSAGMVSEHVKALEERLGARLLNRTTRKLSLTEVGRTYYERCTRILADLEEAEQAASDLHAAPRGELRVNASPSFGMMQLAPAISDFTARFPSVSVELTLSDRMVDLIDEGFDLAVRVEPLPDSSLIARQLTPVRLAICAAPSYIARHGSPRTPADLAKHNCLTLTGPSHFQQWFLPGSTGDPADVFPAGNLRSNSAGVLMCAALAGHGLICLPSYIAGDALRSGRLVSVLNEYPTPTFTLRALYPSNRHLSAKVRGFVDFLAERFGKEPAWDDWRRVLSEETAA
jgi:DNA-binding transcriptional LysR family regulator